MNTVMKNEEKKEYCVPEMTVLDFVQEGNLLCGSPNDPSCPSDEDDESVGFTLCKGDCDD